MNQAAFQENEEQIARGGKELHMDRYLAREVMETKTKDFHIVTIDEGIGNHLNFAL